MVCVTAVADVVVSLFVFSCGSPGQCGSCWSFSATGSMEGAVALAGHNLTSLSEQQLMDCDPLSNSCEGGSMTSAFLYAVLNGGMCTEASYPYQGVDESPCQTCTAVSKISAWTDVFYNVFDATDDEYLMAAVQNGPVSVAVEADQDAWQKYAYTPHAYGCAGAELCCTG